MLCGADCADADGAEGEGNHPGSGQEAVEEVGQGMEEVCGAPPPALVQPRRLEEVKGFLGHYAGRLMFQVTSRSWKCPLIVLMKKKLSGFFGHYLEAGFPGHIATGRGLRRCSLAML